jgi:hypothetical protein
MENCHASPQATKPKPERVNLQIRVQKSFLELVELHAEFIGASHEYAVMESVNRLLKRDHDFQRWLARHSDAPTVWASAPKSL